jgi:hypothetical protein
VKGGEGKRNGVVMSLRRLAQSQDARETVNGKICKPIRADRGIVTNVVKTLPYALAVLHELRVVNILARM